MVQVPIALLKKLPRSHNRDRRIQYRLSVCMVDASRLSKKDLNRMAWVSSKNSVAQTAESSIGEARLPFYLNEFKESRKFKKSVFN